MQQIENPMVRNEPMPFEPEPAKLKEITIDEDDVKVLVGALRIQYEIKKHYMGDDWFDGICAGLQIATHIVEQTLQKWFDERGE
jgi:hypothetical protein